MPWVCSCHFLSIRYGFPGRAIARIRGEKVNTYFQVSVVLPRAKVEIASAQLFELGCCGVAEEDISDGVRLIAYFEAVQNKAEIEQALVPYECRFEQVPDTDWTLAWRSFFQTCLSHSSHGNLPTVGQGARSLRVVLQSRLIPKWRLAQGIMRQRVWHFWV